MNPYARKAPWYVVAAVVGLAALWLVSAARSPKYVAPVHLEEVARIPIVDRGRLKPLDTLARTNLMIISGRQTFQEEKEEKDVKGDTVTNYITQPAMVWLLDVMVSAEDPKGRAYKHKVFRIDNDQVLNLLGLQPRHGFRYAIEEFQPKIKEFYQHAFRVRKLEVKDRNLFDAKVVELAQHFEIFEALAQGKSPFAVPPVSRGEEWKPFSEYEDELKYIALERLRAAEKRGDLPDLKKLPKDKLLALIHKEMEDAREAMPVPARSWKEILTAYAADNSPGFTTAVANHRKLIESATTEKLSRTDFEVFFNNFEPFYRCSLLYVFVFLLACCSWITYPESMHQTSSIWRSVPETLRRSAFWLAVLTLVVHTWALCARMYLQGRPPVTNLYSSAVFIGWGCVVLGLILEWIYPLGIGSAMSAVLGSLTLLIAHHLSTSGDTLEMMQAVLDTNFWLATHVTCVTLGYTATFVAGFLGLGMILVGVLTPWLNKDLFKAMGRMIYGVVCFATLLSFTGTVLGGIWADYSWGRFWGWDPKENGALLIVLWNALILHARWGGMVQQRGMAVLSLFGNVITAWSWFGVNMLGVGLHSYGFMNGAVFWLIFFVVSQLIVMGIGLIPLQYWNSFAMSKAETTPPAADSMPSDRRDVHVKTAQPEKKSKFVKA